MTNSKCYIYKIRAQENTYKNNMGSKFIQRVVPEPHELNVDHTCFALNSLYVWATTVQDLNPNHVVFVLNSFNVWVVRY